MALASSLLLFTAACGDDDGGGVRNLGSGSGSGSGSPSGTGTGTGTGTEVAACSPVGAELESGADQRVDVTLKDYAFEPAALQVPAGSVTFAAKNTGTENHELAFLPGGGDVPLTAEGAPDEAALEQAGAFELEAFGPGLDCNATYDLDPGTYTMFCIVESSDGATHLSKGMKGTLTVGS